MTSRDSGALRRGILLYLPYGPYFPLHGRFYPSIPGPHPGRRAGNRMNSAPNAAFRVDRSPSLCSAGRFDIIELLHGDLHRLRRPQGARRSPEALVSEKRRMVSAACCERVRASVEVCATCPSIDGPDRRRERLDRGRERLGAPPGAQNSSFLLDS